MPGLEPLKPETLDAEQRKLYDAVLDSPRGQGPARRLVLRDDGTLAGPFDAFLRTPVVGLHLERLGMAFRTDTVLSDAAREMAVLVVAQAWGADFEWWVHGLVARQFGISDGEIDAVGHGDRPDFSDEAVSAAHDVAVALVHQRAVDCELLERARGALGERGLVEVVMLVGFYQLVSGVLTTFEPPPPSGDFDVVGPPTSGARPG